MITSMPSDLVEVVMMATDDLYGRYIAMIERRDGHGWALPGGFVDPGESPADTANRELNKIVMGGVFKSDMPRKRYIDAPRYVNDLRINTIVVRVDLGNGYPGSCYFPGLHAFFGPRTSGDAKDAAWIRANSHSELCEDIRARHGVVFPPHEEILRGMHNPRLDASSPRLF